MITLSTINVKDFHTLYITVYDIFHILTNNRVWDNMVIGFCFGYFLHFYIQQPFQKGQVYVKKQKTYGEDYFSRRC